MMRIRTVLALAPLLLAACGNATAAPAPATETPPATAPAPPPKPALPTSMGLQPAFPALRHALGEGDRAGVDAALKAQSTTAGQQALPPGLTFRALLLQGKTAAACAALDDVNLPSAALAKARSCVGGKAGTDIDLVANLTRVALEAPTLLFATDVDAALLLKGARAATSAERERLLTPALTLPLPPFDKDARKRIADALLLLATSTKAGGEKPAPSPSAAKAVERLVFELPEFATAAHVQQMAERATTEDALVRRAGVLERLQRNDEVVALVGALANAKARTPNSCEAALLVGKAERKLRHYAKARVALAKASAPACGEVRKKARYLEVRVAVIQHVKGADALAEAFVKDYGDDSYVDDVLLWLADAKAGRDDVKGEAATLERLLKSHPAGDMARDARFRLALLRAKADDDVGARALLREAIGKAEADGDVVAADRAHYWRARLQAMPHPDRWDAHLDATVAREGFNGLSTFAASRPTTFYGRIAQAVVAQHGPTAAKGKPGTPAVVAGAKLQKRSALPNDASVPLPADLAKNPIFAAARAAAAAGFDDDAAVLVGALGKQPDLAHALAIAALFMQVDRPDLSHRTLRNSGFAVLPDAPDTAHLVPWVLGWPIAFADALTPAANAHKVPVPMLMGLSREESAFDASVVSWAGAVGLCQLMPPTAKDEARSLKLKPPTVEDLRAPALNATLGASHLGRRLRSMKHPFLAIAAYNAGPGAVRRWLPTEGTIPVDLWVEQIPFDETRNYVKKVTNSWATYAALDGDLATVVFDLDVAG